MRGEEPFSKVGSLAFTSSGTLLQKSINQTFHIQNSPQNAINLGDCTLRVGLLLPIAVNGVEQTAQRVVILHGRNL